MRPNEGPGSLAVLLTRHRERMIQAWRRRVLDDPSVPEANKLSTPALADHIPTLIDDLVQSLGRRYGRPSSAEAVGRDIGSDEPAKRHALLRFNQEYSLASALRELSHFRAVLVGLCYEEAAHVEGEEAQLVHAAIDEAITTVAVEMEQAARAQLQRETNFRERFIAILGHDLRSPLNGITFAAAAMLGRDDLPDSHARSTRRIARSASRMTRMIDELLDFARSRQGGGIPLNPKPMDLTALCRHVIEEVEVANPNRDVKLDTKGTARGIWDADRLAQVLSNLLSNAINYGPPGTPVQVALTDMGASVLLSVKNEGSAIPAEAIPTLFDPFRRAAEPTAGTPPSEGLGLGLFIVQQIVQGHRGTIEVESGASGTTFRVELPRPS